MIVRAWPVFGRDATVTQVVELLTDGVNVVLTGAAGIGKTTLASTASAAYAGRVVPIVGSPGSSAIPLAPLTSLIGDAIGHAAIVAARAALDVHRGPESDSLPPSMTSTPSTTRASPCSINYSPAASVNSSRPCVAESPPPQRLTGFAAA